MHLCSFSSRIRGKVLTMKGDPWISFDYEKGSVGQKTLGNTDVKMVQNCNHNPPIICRIQNV